MWSKLISERDEFLLNLRQETYVTAQNESAGERFQNATLRPILKFQNAIILAQFRKYVEKFNPSFKAYNKAVQMSFIDGAFKSDPRLRNSMIASAVALMTIEEYEKYCNIKNEANKRIIQLISKRIADQIEFIY